MSEKNLTPATSDKREIVLEMTQEKHDEMKARGIDEEAIPAVGPHTYRRRARRLDASAAKIRVTAFIDADLVAYFRQRAEKPDAAPFEAQLNQALRAAMKQAVENEDQQIKQVTETLLNNQAFLNALSEKLRAA
jgi:uncharacterized protein (DUF4415 family)